MLKHKKITWLTIVLACLLVFPLAIGCSSPAEEPAPVEAPKAEVQNWRLQGQHPSEDERHILLGHFTEIIEAMTDGQIVIDFYPTGALVPVEEMLDAQAKGVIEMAEPCGGYFGGVDPAFKAAPALWDFREQWEADYFMYHKGGNEIMRKVYAKYGVYNLGLVKSGSPEIVYSNKAIRRVSDFQGLKMRSYGQFIDFFTELGAAAVYLPGDEIVPALATGAIDAAEWASPLSNYQVGFHEVTDYQIWPTFISALGGCELTMGLDLWNSLTPQFQAIFAVATSETNSWIHPIYQTNDRSYFNKMLVEGNMEEVWIAEEDYPLLVAAADKVRDDIAAEGGLAAEMVNAIRDYMRELGYM
ncbi:TRAP transporter substrate-binding protein DctP [Chloroflexota bacterium]